MGRYSCFVLLSLLPILGFCATTSTPGNDKKVLHPGSEEKAASVEGAVKGRALGGTNLTHPEGALDDVSMDDSIENNQQCVEGQIVDRGCEERCHCVRGSLQCAPRCPLPLQKSGMPTGDPDCFLQPVRGDDCCATLVCSSEAEAPSYSSDGCSHNNNTYKFGEVFHVGCDLTCHCLEDGTVNCTDRCPQHNRTSSDRCLSVTDPKDACCSILYCDVNAGDDLALEEDLDRPRLVSAVPANSSTVMLNFEKISVLDKVNAEQSVDQKMWETARTRGQAVLGLEPGKTYYFRVMSEDGMPSNVVSATLPNFVTNTTMCEFKGKQYKLGEEFHDNCTAYCVCSSSGVECASIDCPTDFGLDVLDPACLEWEPVPAGFKPSPPNCCPQSVVCKNNGSCVYQGSLFDNWQDIPDKLSGCEEKCFCSSGNVTCRPRCPAVTETPPLGLHCSPKKPAILTHPPGEMCCLIWMCPEDGYGANVTNSSINETTTALPKGGPSIPFLGPYNPDLVATIKLSPTTPTVTTLSPPSKESTSTDQIIPNATTLRAKPNVMVTSKNASLSPTTMRFSPTVIPSTEQPTTTMPDRKEVDAPLHDDATNVTSPDHEHHFQSPLSPFFGNAVTPSPNIPIGIINPDKLRNQGELSEGNALQTGPSKTPLPGPGPVVNPAFLEHLLEYHKYKDDVKPDHPKPPLVGHDHGHPYNPVPPASYKPSVPINGHSSYNPQNPAVRPGEHHNQIISPYNKPNGQPPKIDESEDYPDNPYINHAGQEQQIPPELYHLINQGHHHNPYSQQNQLPSSPSHHFVPPDQLYHVVDNRNRPQHKQPVHPYYNDIPNKQDHHLFQRPGAPPLGLADIIDHIRQHEETDSRTKDTHVYVLASQPPNVGQAKPHPGISMHQPNDPNGIIVHHLEAIDDGTVRLIFSVPAVLVGLHGRVELRYTSDPKNNDPYTWERQVLAPPGDMIATPELEFELKGLQPDTEYKIKITVVMRDLDNSPTSEVLVVKTLPGVLMTTPPPIIPVEPKMRVTKVNSTWATVEWRKFDPQELQYIDGVQLRYKEINGKVYQATPLIHRAVTSYTIDDLKPDSQYEIGIFFIPFPEQNTELQAQKTISLNTTIENDPFKFELTLDIHHIKSTSVEITWNGVPYPEDKYVNIFRAIYQYEGGREDMNTFKVAKRDSPAGTLIIGLKPETRYRLWLEAYLTNGRTKKSNVKDFTTKVGVYPVNELQEGKLEGTPIRKENDYYGPLVGVSILAAITTLATVGLLVIIAKKHGHNKAPITAAVQRKTAPHTAAYDNPSYKAEMQHETLDL